MAQFASQQPLGDRSRGGGSDRRTTPPRPGENLRVDLRVLQRSAGNRAVADLLARVGGPGIGLATVQRDRAKQPGGKQPGGKKPVGGKSPGAGNQPGGGKDPGSAAKAEPATGTQAGGSPMTPQKQELIDSGTVNQVNLLFDVIQKLRAQRIDTWAQTAASKQSKPLREALEVAVAMVALGAGGVFGTLLTSRMAHGLYQEFVLLAGLEGGDIAVEHAFQAAMSSTQQALAKGTMASLATVKVNAQAALTADKNGMLGVFVEAAKLQTITEQFEQASEFNATAPTSYGASALADRYLTLKAIYLQLLAEPEVFHRELSEGFMRLLDENIVTEHATAYGGDRNRTRKEDASLEEGYLREGVLRMCPTGGYPGEHGGFSIGTWGRPTLAFADFGGWATGTMNTATLMKMANTPIMDLPLTLDVFFWAQNPYSGWLEVPQLSVGFTRNPDGSVQMARGLGEEAEEWLASYYSGISAELTDQQRKTFAPLGALKLYEATKHKPVRKLENSDLL